MTLSRPIYLDFNASTPPDPSAIAAMRLWLEEGHANPHAAHLAGQRAASAIDEAVSSIRRLINATSGDIVFTSGATESNNLALRGMASSNPFDTCILCTPIEHKSVLEVVMQLEKEGVTVDLLPVDSGGYVSAQKIEGYLRKNVCKNTIVSVMHSNNEIGTIQPILDIARLKKDYDFTLHVDAAQSVGKIPVDVNGMEIDLLSLSSHKLYGPSGIGALFVSTRVRHYLKPILYGGGQQNGVRPGTLPVFLVAGFGAACEKAMEVMISDAGRVNALAALFCERLESLGVSFRRISPIAGGLPGLLSISFDGVGGDDLMLAVAPIMSISTGSACNSRELQSSHVLRAIGLSESEARGVVRIGFGRFSSVEHAHIGAETVASAVRRLASAG